MKFLVYFMSLTMAFNIVSTSVMKLDGQINIPAPEPEVQSVTMSFTGDCILGTYLGGRGEGSFNWYAANYEPTYFLENVAEIFENDDFTVVNCETVLSDDTSMTPRDKGEGTNFWFLGPSTNAEILSSSGVEIAGVVNNHYADYGSKGQKDTIAALEAEGIAVLDANKPLYMEKNGITISILACGMWYGGMEKSLYSTLDEMCSNSDVQVLFPHGGAEGTHTIDVWRKQSCRNLIDHGADIIVTCHPHVLQPVEEYKGGIIVYSLGNFCYGGSRYPENRTAIYQCTVTKTDEGITYEGRVIPCYVYTGSVNNWQPMPMDETDPNYEKVIEYMAGMRSDPM